MMRVGGADTDAGAHSGGGTDAGGTLRRGSTRRGQPPSGGEQHHKRTR